MKAKIITLCGDVKFKDVFLETNEDLVEKGNIVLLPALSAKHTNSQLSLIDMADEVLIINVRGQIDPNTKSKIEYAESKGKIVSYLEKPIGRMVDFMTAMHSKCKVRVEHEFISTDYEKEQFSNHFKNITELFEIFGTAWHENDVREIIINGDWYILN